MDLNRIQEAFESDITPLVRTDFSDDNAWRTIVARVSAPVDFNNPDNDDPGEDGYAPNITVVDDAAFDGVSGAALGEAFRTGREIVGYALLADARSMGEAANDSELTLDYVDLSVLDPEDAELFNTFTGRSFRVAVSEFASIESNLAIANMDFHEFADNTDPDGVFRGFPAEAPEPEWPVEREPGLAAARAVIADLTAGPGARRLSGSLGDLTIELEFRDTRTRLFNRVGCVFGWPPCKGGSGMPGFEVGHENFYDATLPDSEGRHEQHGSIRTTIVEVDKPSRLIRAWNWLLPSPDGSLRLSDHRPLLDADAVLTLDFVASDSTSEEPSTQVRLRLSGIPVEWKDDFTALWTWDMVRFASQP